MKCIQATEELLAEKNMRLLQTIFYYLIIKPLHMI